MSAALKALDDERRKLRARLDEDRGALAREQQAVVTARGSLAAAEAAVTARNERIARGEAALAEVDAAATSLTVPADGSVVQS